MTTTRLEEQEWHRYFSAAKNILYGRLASVQVVGADVGAQRVADRVSLLGVTFDPKGHLLDVALDGLNHLIQNPREIYVDEAPSGAIAMDVVDADGRKHIIQIGDRSVPPR
ncbi:DUF5335 family protein [Azospirillum formosense]|uniref:DUF5335 family protein n=1 Tax=Azospirillum formosense TaxID=861533 RepID=UPI001C90FE8A|nr:DUF5335 family protein [Azospirillum formosense]MBY3757041.1 DUF5335 family protein [Azospirillum formosense]